MSGGSSPKKSFSASRRDYDYDVAFDPTFSAEISDRMQVPKKIRVSGDGSESDDPNTWLHSNTNGHIEKVAMQVPDRILVTGQNTHRGTKALPRELQLESMAMPPPDPEIIRIQTPPRSITVMESHYPHSSGVSDDETLIVENNRARFGASANGNVSMSEFGGGDSLLLNRSHRGSIQNYEGSGEPTSKEMEHLREQLGRMNHRMLNIEDDLSERKERERYLLMAGFIWFVYKVATWMFRTGHHR